MSAKDVNGKEVGFGDYVCISLEDAQKRIFAGGTATVARIIRLNQTPKGVFATGAFVAMSDNGRVVRVPFDPAKSVLVRKSDGAEVAE